MEIERVIVGELEENCYIVSKDGECLIIDPGSEFDKIKDKVGNREVLAVLVTHHHFDHSANNCYFEKAYMAAEAVPLVSIPYKSFEGMDFFPDSYEKVVVEDGA